MHHTTIIVAAFAGLAAAQSGSVSFVVPDDTYIGNIDVEVWGTWTGIDGGRFAVPALAGFGLDLAIETNTNGTRITGPAEINPALLLGSNEGAPSDGALTGVSGGQLANLFGFANPNIDVSDPILLFTFPMDLNLTQLGDFVELSFSGVNPNGGLVVYPDSEAGASIAFPNEGPLDRISTTIAVIPAPGVAALVGFGLLGRRRR